MAWWLTLQIAFTSDPLDTSFLSQVTFWRGSTKDQFISVASMLENWFNYVEALAIDQAAAIAKEMPREKIVYAQLEGRNMDKTDHPCVCVTDISYLMQHSGALSILVAQHENRPALDTAIDTVVAMFLGMIPPPEDTFVIELKVSRKHKRYLRDKYHQLHDPNFYERKRANYRRSRERQKQQEQYLQELATEHAQHILSLTEADTAAQTE